MHPMRCNSTYRSRYAPQGVGQQRSKATMRSAHRKYLSKAKVKQRWSAIVLTVYGMRRRVCGSRGAKRRWGPHISYLSKAKVKQRWWENSTYRLVYIIKELHILLGVCYLPTTLKKLYPRSSKVEFLFINLYNSMLIVSNVCLIYN